MLLEIEVQGARQVREAMPEATQVFIAPPSEEALRTRLVGRGTDSRRAGRARGSRPRARSSTRRREFGHVVVNDRLEDAVAELEALVRGQLAGRTLESVGPRTEDLTLISPRVDKLLDNVDSPYASVIVAAKRARQINSYYHNLGEGTFEEFPPPMIDTGSKNYLTIALEEVANGKIKYRYRG